MKRKFIFFLFCFCIFNINLCVVENFLSSFIQKFQVLPQEKYSLEKVALIAGTTSVITGITSFLIGRYIWPHSPTSWANIKREPSKNKGLIGCSELTCSDDAGVILQKRLFAEKQPYAHKASIADLKEIGMLILSNTHVVAQKDHVEATIVVNDPNGQSYARNILHRYNTTPFPYGSRENNASKNKYTEYKPVAQSSHPKELKTSRTFVVPQRKNSSQTKHKNLPSNSRLVIHRL